MDTDLNINKLEEVVERLLEKYETLKTQCEELTIELAETKSLLGEVQEQKITLTSEKESVHTKVSSILEKLNVWESEQTGEMLEVNEDSETPKDNGGQLFTMGSSS